MTVHTTSRETGPTTNIETRDRDHSFTQARLAEALVCHDRHPAEYVHGRVTDYLDGVQARYFPAEMFGKPRVGYTAQIIAGVVHEELTAVMPRSAQVRTVEDIAPKILEYLDDPVARSLSQNGHQALPRAVSMVLLDEIGQIL